MKQRRAREKQEKQEKGAISILGDYMKASKAKREYIIELSEQVPVRRRGRPVGSKSEAK
jgi:hypothetical protein